MPFQGSRMTNGLHRLAADVPHGFEKPLGFRDYLPQSVTKIRAIESLVGALFREWGYEEVITPTLEYDDTVGGASATFDHKLFKLLDKRGRTLVLRPDMTTPIARVVSSLLREEMLPLRLSYAAHIFRAQEKEAGREAEFQQMGAELIGDASPDGDAEMIALAVETLKKCRVKPFKLAIGHIGFLNAFLREYVSDAVVLERLKGKLNDHNYVGYRQLIGQLPLSEAHKQRMNDLLLWRGGDALLQKRLREARSVEERAALHHLCDLWKALEMYGVAPFVTLDFSLIGQMDYYTGIYFEGYAEQLGVPLLSGGRYDSLLAQFGRPAAAVGFQLKVDRLLEISSPPEKKSNHYLIVFDPSERLEAIYMAAKWRRKKHRVTMQVSTELAPSEVAHLRQRYDDLVVLRGTEDEA